MPAAHNLTTSERLFEQFSEENVIGYNRIAEEKTPTPDYEIKFGDHRVIVEVKELDSNISDLEAFHDLRSRGQTGMWKEPGHRLRLKIEESKKQLKLKSQERCPVVLVLYDNVVLPSIDWDDFRIAMYGLEIEVLDIPQDRNQEPTVIARRSGYKAKFTRNRNTTFSALGLLYKSNDDRLNLILLHNFYAKNPIDVDWLRRDTVKHFRLDPTNRENYPKWEQL
jgi:hypothetical protein